MPVPRWEAESNLSFFSSHYIGHIPLELYQTALQSESTHDPNDVAGRILIDQIQGLA